MKPFVSRVVGVLVLGMLAACAASTAPPGGDDDQDASVEADADVADAFAWPDASNIDAAPKKGFGEPCANKSECESNICVFNGLSGVCSMVCGPPDCPMGYGCYSVNGGIEPGQVAEICVPESDQLCSPCSDSTECGGGAQNLCVTDADGLEFCGRDCSTITQCPAGYTCGTVTLGQQSYKQCVPVSGACDCTATDQGETKPCMIPTPFGMCLGAKSCNGAAGWGTCAPPSAADEPDGSYADENCDGIDGTYAAGIFVAPTGSDSGTCGLVHTDPCKTVQHGIIRALSSARGALYVQAGTYDGVVVLQNSIDIYGGYNTSWQRASRTTPGHETRLRGGLDATDAQYMTIKASGLIVPTIVADVVIEGPDAEGTVGPNGRSSYAVYVNNSQGLTLQRVSILAGKGAPGATGTAGADAFNVQVVAPQGADGGGANEISSSCNTSTRGQGGAPAQNSCGGGTSTKGGRGGNGGTIDSDCICILDACTCLPSGCSATNGDTGQNATVVSGSFGVGGGPGAGASLCSTPSPGNPGFVVNGAAGAGAVGGGRLIGNFWYAREGSSGGTGQNGGGGGGGGGAGGCDKGTDTHGSGGGGGGAGGCGAQAGGGGGGGGGGSFGVFAIGSSVSLSECAIQLGIGGAGGAGGHGGRGQSGGDGGFGGIGVGGVPDGGKGGKGGHGGHGGGGGGGAGGIAYGLYGSASTFNQTCTFFGGGAGSPGLGGKSAPTAPVPERDGNDGSLGAAGVTGNLGLCATPSGC